VYQSQWFGDPLPDPLAWVSGYFGQRFNYYLRVAE
jgi:hypothetical protein